MSGTVTTINTETIELSDNIILLNSNAVGNASENGGIEIERGADLNVSLIWDETADRWTFGAETVYTSGGFIGDVTGQVSDISNFDTDSLSEGSINKYFSNSLARDSVSASGDITYNSLTGEFSLVEDFVNAASFVTTTGALSLVRRNGGEIEVNLDGRYLLASDADHVSGATFNSSNGVLTLSRVLGGTVAVDLDGRFALQSDLDAAISAEKHLTAHAFDTATGVLTSTLSDESTVTVELDGRYLLQSSYVDDFVSGAAFNSTNGVLTLTRVEGGTVAVDLDGRYVESVAAGAGLSNSGAGQSVVLDVNVDRGLSIVSDNVGIADTGVTAGSYGAADSVSTFTVNSRGQLTVANNTAISIVASQVSDFGDAVKAALAMTHSDVYTVSAAAATANSGANPEFSWATLGFNLSNKDMYSVYLNRLLLRPTEYTVSSTGITFDQFLLAEDDEIEAVMLG